MSNSTYLLSLPLFFFLLLDINYAKYYGITEGPAVAVAIIFSAFFVICVIYAIRLFHEKTIRSVFPYMCTFCLVRIIAFALRAKVATNGTNVNLFVVEQIVYSAGFFAVINVSYNLLKTWFLQGKSVFPESTQKLITNIARISHIVLIVAVGVGIFGGVRSSPSNSPDTVSSGLTLTHVSRWIFLVLTLLYLLIAFYGTYFIFAYDYSDDDTSVMKKTILVLVLLGLIINLRTAFNVASNTHTSIFYNEKLFYPLSVLPELLVLSVYCFPGVVKRFAYTPDKSLV